MLIPALVALAVTEVLSPVKPPGLFAHPVTELSRAGGSTRHALARMQERRHEVELHEGEFLQVVVRQHGVDVKVRLLAPDGAEIEGGIDSSEGPEGKEPASILAAVSGTHAIEVWAPGDVREDEPGEYAIEVEPPRLPDARDRTRLRAERLMAVAGRVMGPRVAGVRRNRPSSEHCEIARPAYEEAERLWAELGETCWRAEAATCQGIQEMWAVRVDRSEQALDGALQLWDACEEDGADYKFLEAAFFLGRLHVSASRLEEAIAIHELGLERSRGRDPMLVVQFLAQLSLAYGLIGDTERAIQRGEEVLAMVRRRQMVQGQAVVLTYLANAHLRRGALQQASDLALQALAIRREVGEELGIVATLLLVADVHEALGEPEAAQRYLEEIVRSYPIAPSETARAGIRLAAILRRSGRTAEAGAYLQRALEVAHTNSSFRRIEAEALVERARLQIAVAEWGGARASVDAVVALLERVGDLYLSAEAQELSGIVHLQSGDREGARAAFAESLRLRRAIGDRVGEAAALYQQARLALRAADDAEAERRLEEARAIVAEQRVRLATPQLRATWTGTLRQVDEAYVGLLMDRHRRRPGEGFDARAFEASESSSARALLDALEEPATDAASGSLAERERASRGHLLAALDRQMRARASGEPREAQDAIDRVVRDLSTEHQRVLALRNASDPGFAALAAPPSVRLADVQGRLLEADTTLLEFFLGGERGYAWVVGSDRLHAYELPGRARVESAVDAVRSALSRPPAPRGPDRAAPALRALADLILPADRSQLRGRRLVVVADGALHHVPFAALPDADGRPLVARLEVASIPSASVADVLRRRLAQRAPAPRAVAVVADPVYDGGDERLAGRSPGPLDAAVRHATRDFGFVDGRLPRLPFTRREALAIARLAPAGEVSVSLDFRANLDAALAPELASYRYLHFAAHGLLNDVRPDLSGIVLSLVDAKGRARPGLLAAPDVSSLRLGADLVVLSGCRSAAGREVRGEGLVGLTRAFMSAGAPRVIASLWPVDDVSSSELMTAMYRRLLGSAQAPPAVALRAAQLATMRDPRWRAPYYWAGFQLQGEWR